MRGAVHTALQNCLANGSPNLGVDSESIEEDLDEELDSYMLASTLKQLDETADGGHLEDILAKQSKLAKQLDVAAALDKARADIIVPSTRDSYRRFNHD